MITNSSKTIVSQPGFTLKRVTKLDHAEHGGVKVEFDYEPAADEIPQLRSVSGWVLYDPERLWVIQQFNVETVARRDAKRTIVGTMEYEDAKDGLPLLKRCIRIDKGGDKGSAKEHKFEFAFNVAEGDVPENEFTLSAFGLPEPGAARAFPWYLWAALLGFFCLGLGIIVRRRAQRT